MFFRTHELIKTHYGSLDAFLGRHGSPELFCVQETRLKSSSLTQLADCKALGACAQGYESYWAFNELKGAVGGSCGVAVFVKKELAKGASATQRVLQADLDAEGRCLLVDLGPVAVFNVYAPVLRSGEEQAKKLRFLELLKQRVAEMQRTKMVLLCGDLNLTWRPQDACGLMLEVKDGCVAGRSVGASMDGATWMRLGEALKLLEKRAEEVTAQELAAYGRTWHAATEPDCVAFLQGWHELHDTFAICHPCATRRFTHWMQMANLRFSNKGSRLDYILCDEALLLCLKRTESSQLAGATEHCEGHTGEAAWNAATNFGTWHGAHQAPRQASSFWKLRLA